MLLRAEIIHQKANELVRACGTRDTLRIAREIGIYVRFVDGLENLLGMYTYRHKERHIILSTRMEDSYEVDEIPDGYEMKFQFESNGAMQNEWVKSGSVLTWQYITNPLCPWEEPSREYELVNVSGVQAKYWPNLVSEEEAYIDSTAGAQFSARIDYGIERTAVLMWEDLETNTIFRLRGVLSKEDILYMAESMTRSEKSNKT